ncbi:ATPase [Lachnospiraceae bacterium]|nr:ATPase [Lachnospiraceae bacterium]
MSSRIEQVIDEIEDFIENCKYQPLSNSKIIVNKDELEDLLSELRRRTPDEIKRYQKIISNKEAILADAQTKADAIIAKAEVHTTELISEHQIMQQAYAQANEVVMIATNQAEEILNNATNDANAIRMSAIEYTDGLLTEIEGILGNAMETTRARTENLLSSLQGYYEQIDENRRSLVPSEMETIQTQEGAPEPLSEIQMTDIR